MLKITNLNKHFEGVKAVADCSFEIKENLIIALIGPNGAGKSTIFNLISGITKPDSGQIIFKDKNIVGLSIDKIANLGISRLFQQSRLFNNLTVFENLLLAKNNSTGFFNNLFTHCRPSLEEQKEIFEILKIFNLQDYANAESRNLSYGQKRLVEIARAILKPHKLIILDEPVAGINPKLRSEMTKYLLQLKQKNETILLIEHDMNFVLNIADQVIVMEEGKVIADGKPEEIKNNPLVLEAYLGT